MAKEIRGPNDCRDVRAVENCAERHGGIIRRAGGSHAKIINPSNGESVIEVTGHGNQMSNGVARSIFKKFVLWGWLVFLFIPAAYLLLGGCQASIA